MPRDPEPGRRPPTPHDTLFRSVFGRRRHAMSFFRAMLPAPVSAALQLSRASPCDGGVQDDRLFPFRADVVWRVPYRGAPGHLLLGLEHQSASDRMMSYRQLRYGVLLCDHELREGAGLSLHFPMVLHHGDSPWPTRRQLVEATNAPTAVAEALAGEVPDYRLHVVDLAVMSEAEVTALPVTPLVRLTLLVFKFGRSRDLVRRLGGWLPHLAALIAAPGGWSDLERIVRYLIEVGDVEVPVLARYLRALSPRAQELVMTTAERIREEVREEERQRRESLVEQARHQAQVRLVTRLLRLRFRRVPRWVSARLAAASEAQLDTFADRILTAETIEEVVAD